MDRNVWVPLASAALGALAGLGGAWLVTRGQAATARRARLEDAYAAFMVAAHNVELHLSNLTRRQQAQRKYPIPEHLGVALTHAMSTITLLAPTDTHQAVDDYGHPLLRGAIWPEVQQNDVRPNVARWEAAITLMRRDLGTH